MQGWKSHWSIISRDNSDVGLLNGLKQYIIDYKKAVFIINNPIYVSGIRVLSSFRLLPECESNNGKIEKYHSQQDKYRHVLHGFILYIFKFYNTCKHGKMSIQWVKILRLIMKRSSLSVLLTGKMFSTATAIKRLKSSSCVHTLFKHLDHFRRSKKKQLHKIKVWISLSSDKLQSSKLYSSKFTHM